MQFGCANPGIKGAIAQEDPKIHCAQGKIECARANLIWPRETFNAPAGSMLAAEHYI